MRKYPHYIKGEKKATKYAEHGLIFVLLFCFRWYIHRKEYGRRNTKMFSSVQLLIRVWLFVSPWTVACQASLSITNSQSLLKSCPLSQWCHPTISSSIVPFPPALNLSQHQGLSKWVSSSHQVAKVLEFQLQHQSFQWTFRTDFL